MSKFQTAPVTTEKRESNQRGIQIFWDDLISNKTEISYEFNMDTACVELKFANRAIAYLLNYENEKLLMEMMMVFE